MRLRSEGAAAGAALLTLLAGCDRGGPDPAPGAGAETADPVAIELLHRATVIDSTDAVNFPDYGAVLRDGADRIFVQTAPGTDVAVFDEEGRFLSLIGRAGEGPGELAGRAMPVITSESDSLYIWDPFLQRVSVHGPELEFARSFHLPFRPSFLLPDGSLVGIQLLRTRERIGYPAHRASADGELLGSFGQNPPRYRADEHLFHQKRGAPAANGRAWLSAVGRYELELWDPVENRPLARLRPEAPWFDERPLPVRSFLTERPGGTVTGLWSEGEQRIWVIAQIAAEGWEPCCNGEPQTHRAVDLAEMGQYLDWMLQAVDAETGAVLAERRFPEPIFATQGGGELVTTEVDEETGWVSFSLWQPILSSDGGDE